MFVVFGGPLMEVEAPAKEVEDVLTIRIIVVVIISIVEEFRGIAGN